MPFYTLKGVQFGSHINIFLTVQPREEVILEGENTPSQIPLPQQPNIKAKLGKRE